MIRQIFPVRFQEETKQSIVLRDGWAELHRIWTGGKPIIGASNVSLDFIHVAVFQNEGDSKASGADNREKNRTFSSRVILGMDG